MSVDLRDRLIMIVALAVVLAGAAYGLATADDDHASPPSVAATEPPPGLGNLPEPTTTVYKEGLRADVYRSAASGTRPAVLLVHGGGLRFGSRQDLSGLGARLSAAGFVVATVDYTLGAGAAPATADVRDALEWLRGLDGVDPARVAILGQSAGGELAARVGYGRAAVRAVVLVSTPPGPVLRLVGKGDPASLQVHGTADTIVDREVVERLDELLARNGVSHRVVTVQGAGHYDAASRAGAEITAWLRRELAPSG